MPRRQRAKIKQERMEHITYILANIEKLIKDDRMQVLLYLVKQGAQIFEGADGCRVNLDKLPTHQLKKIHYIIEYAIDVVLNDPERCI